jgi:phage/plasmid-associated DNA primase
MAYLADITSIMPASRPLTVAEDTRAWRRTSDRIMAFFDAHLMPSTGGAIAKSDLYAQFTDWLKENGHASWSQELFFTRMQRHELFRQSGLSEARQRGTNGLSRPKPRQWSALEPLPAAPRVIRGIRFREDADDMADVVSITA